MGTDKRCLEWIGIFALAWMLQLDVVGFDFIGGHSAAIGG